MCFLPQNAHHHHYVHTFEKKLERTKQKKEEFEESAKDVLEKLNAILEKKKSKEEKFKNVQEEMDKLHKVGIFVQLPFAVYDFYRHHFVIGYGRD